MRRIFGNNPLASSSTSNSLASDSLPSPVPSLTSSNHSQLPASSSTGSFDQRPTQGSYDSYNASHDDEPQRKGWFGGAINTGAAPAVPRSSSASSSNFGAGSSNGGRNGQQQPPRGGGEEDVEAINLPFSSSRSQAPPRGASPIDAGARSAGPHSRSVSQSSGWQPSAATAQGGRPFSPLGERSALSPVPSQGSQKDAMLVELLSGQAVVEAKDYAIMDWDEMQEVKKEHALLATRIATITRSLALETRLRDSAAKLARLSAPSTSTLPPLPSATSKPRVTREQAEAQLAAANAKMDSIAAEMYKLGWKESELRTKLLRHTAGVLGLSLRRKEEEEAQVAQTPLQSSTAAFGSASQHSDQPLSPASRFEGRHFFAGNKDAIAPTTRGASSPLNSPRLGSSMNGSFPSASYDDGSAAKVRDLETKVEELQAALSSARDEHEEQQRTRSADAARSNEIELDQLREELSESRRREGGSREEATTSRREAFDTKRELSELRREAEVLREDLRYAKDASEKAKREAEDTKREMDSVKNYGGEAKRDVEDAKSREEEARQELEKAMMDLREAEHRAMDAEARIAEVEQEVDRVRDEGDDEIRRLQDELETAVLSHGTAGEETEGEKQARAELASVLQERTSITQAVGDVLRRHRTRQPVLRGLPSFDDTTDHHDLPSYLSSSLDSHFDRLTTHATTLSADLDSLSTNLNSLRAEHEEARSGLESSLREATEHRDHFRSEADTHRSAKEDLDRAHDELQARVREQEEQLAALPALQSDLASASAEEGKLRQEISSLKMTLADVEKQLADVSAQQDDHKSRAAAAEQEVAETREKGAQLNQQMKELEERMTVSANQEVTMLERLNDLTESLEQTRGEKRKLDALVPNLQTQVRTLEAEKDSLSQNLIAAQQETSRLAARPDDSAKLAELENELQDLKDQLQDAMEELDDAKAREAKTRGQLLDELSSVQSELSSTRTKLRQAERRNGATK